MEETSTEFRPGRAARLLVAALVWAVLAAGVVWAFGALWFDFPHDWLRKIIAAVCSLLSLVLVAVLVRPRWRAKLAIALATCW